MDETFKTNLAFKGADKKLTDKKLTDKKLNSYITLTNYQPLVVDLKQAVTFNRALVQENIATGQRAVACLLEYYDGKYWKQLSAFTTIGYKRLLRFEPVTAAKIRFTINDSKAPVQLAEFEVFLASERE